MSIKVKFVAPYSSMVPLIEECVKDEQELAVNIEVGNYYEGVEIAKRAVEEGYEVIISRGGTAKIIQESVTIPVIDVHMSGYDMLRVLTLVNAMDKKKALIAYPTMVMGAQTIIDLLGYPVDLFTVSEKAEVSSLIAHLKDQGYRVVMGGVGTVEMANYYGLEGVLIQSGKENIIEAFEKAKDQHRFHKWNQSFNQLLSSTLKLKGQDLMIVSEQGDVLFEVWNSLSECPLSKQELLDIVDENIPISEKKWQHYQKERQQVDIKVEWLNAFEERYLLLSFLKSDYYLKKLPWVETESVKQKPSIIHHSESMDRVMRVIDLGIDTHQLFFLNGEPGTGRGLLANYIHYEKNTNQSFISVDASRCQFELLEDLVPHHVKTLYLRNAGQLPKESFPLLNCFMKRSLTNGKTIIVSANQSILPLLESTIANQILEIFLPPLNDRKEDLKGLVTLFIAHFHQNLGTQPIKLHDDALTYLEEYDWTGNVRELRSFIQTVAMSVKEYVIQAEHIRDHLQYKRESEVSSVFQLEGTLEDIEFQVIQSVLEEENYNQSKVAKRLGINRSTLWRKLKKHDYL
ncbi:sigma-54-dependent transcriptional regulator [Alkalibacillus aidingensis]|uniref:sigma-54-dependent transcriptional regulator n=1 Tax=Alkalibacillus aidingensis TaxID=2747607 RepID=UPI001661882A|nr:sigma-54-dependent transcriptional regulator [Alkalibacillus aidingensis]